MIAGTDISDLLSLPAEQLIALRQAYASPPRAYHHFGHVEDVLVHYSAVAEGPGWHQPREVELAVLYHDAIYMPGRSDNEAESARLAVEHIARWMPQTGIDSLRVAELILLTARHGKLRSGDFADDAVADDTRCFLDCDMAILSAAPEVFAAYDRGIAEEYRAVPRWLYRLNRRRFFKALLASERIYLSDFFRDRFEAQARRNLQIAIASRS